MGIRTENQIVSRLTAREILIACNRSHDRRRSLAPCPHSSGCRRQSLQPRMIWQSGQRKYPHRQTRHRSGPSGRAGSDRDREDLKGTDCRHRHGCGLFKRQVGRLRCHAVFTSTRILGKGSQAFSFERCPEHLVARPDRFLSRPTDSTRPAKSAPAILSFGLRACRSCGKKNKGPLTVKPSSGLTDEAYTLIRASSSAGTGVATSMSCSTSSGGPYCVVTMAFKGSPPSRCEECNTTAKRAEGC